MRNLILLAGCSALLLCGCANERTRSTGTMPVYKVEPPPDFTPDENAVLKDFSVRHPALFEKLKAYSDGNKAILLKHNQRAKEINRERLKELGLKEDELRAWLGDEEQPK